MFYMLLNRNEMPREADADHTTRTPHTAVVANMAKVAATVAFVVLALGAVGFALR